MNCKILVVDDDESSLENIALSLKSKKYDYDLADSFNDAINLLKSQKYGILITDLRLPYKSGLDIISFAMKNISAKSTILITGYADEPSIVSALKMGVDDILKKPYNNNELYSSIKKLFNSQSLTEENIRLKEKLQKENEVLRNYVLRAEDKYKIIGNHSSLQNALKKCDRVAKHSINCLLVGETGTGKELLARYIHRAGPRSKAPFIAINCAELSPSLFESELFGFKKGSFTNAMESKAGLLEATEGGIIFLDEITEIPRELQAKLLRVVETKTIRRIGESDNRKIDVQIISATNKTLDEIEETGVLRNDLFHRLATVLIKLSPLRARGEDIDLLLNFYLNKFTEQFLNEKRAFPNALRSKLKTAQWNGNIRQLTNFVKNWILFGEISDEAEIISWLNNGQMQERNSEFVFKFNEGTVSEIEDAKFWLAKKILKYCNYNKAKAARHFGMTYPGFHKLLKNIQKKEDEA